MHPWRCIKILVFIRTGSLHITSQLKNNRFAYGFPTSNDSQGKKIRETEYL